MRVISDKRPILRQSCAMTVGKFDGLHLGHMALIRKTIEYAKCFGIASAVFTFFPNPVAVLPGKPFEPLLSEEQKIAILSGLGIDILINYPFDKEFAEISPNSFMRLIFEDLRCRALTIGGNFRFGKDREGQPCMLSETGEAYGAIVNVLQNIEFGGEAVSSSRIRRAIADGDMGLAGCLLGRDVYGDSQVEPIRH